MDAVKLFHELAEAMYLSLGQGVIIYLLAKLIIYLLPWLGSSFRYRLMYMSMGIIFLLFAGRMVLAVMDGSGNEIARGSLSAQDTGGHFSLKGLVHQYALLIGLVYLAGLAVQAILLLISLLKIRMLRNRTDLHSDYSWQMRLTSLQSTLNIKRKVILRFGERITSPFTTGWLKPVIYFPLAALNNLTVEQVEAILIHELAHIKRNDYLWNLLQRVMEIVVFFNPVTWVISNEIRREREYCCDDMVLRETMETVLYAKALFVLEKERAGLSLTMAANAGKKQSLLDRIKRITDMDAKTSNGIPRMIAFTGILVFILFLGWTKQTEAVSKTQKSALKSDVVKTAFIKPADTAVNAVPPPPPPTESRESVPPPPPPMVSKKKFSAPPPPPAASKKKLSVPPPPPPVEKSKGITSMTILAGDTSKLASYFKSEQWKQQVEAMKSMGDELKKQFESPEWKKQMEEIKKQSQQLSAQFNSPEWREKMKSLQLSAEEMRKKFSSPEFLASQQKMARKAEELSKQFQSAEWKTKMKDVEKLSKDLETKFNSAEWKKKMQEFQDKAAEMQRKALDEQNKKDSTGK